MQAISHDLPSIMGSVMPEGQERTDVVAVYETHLIALLQQMIPVSRQNPDVGRMAAESISPLCRKRH